MARRSVVDYLRPEMGWDVLRPLPILIGLLGACDDDGVRLAPPSAASGEPASVASSSTVHPSDHDTSGLGSRPMMISFTRDFCLPCQVMAPAVAELRREHAAKVDVVEVNIDREKSDRYALFFVIDSVPTQVFVDASGHVAARHGGMATKDELSKTLRGLGWIP